MLRGKFAGNHFLITGLRKQLHLLARAGGPAGSPEVLTYGDTGREQLGLRVPIMAFCPNLPLPTVQAGAEGPQAAEIKTDFWGQWG